MDSVKEGTPSDEELEEVAVEIGESWESLGRRLKFNDAQITAFDKDNKKYSEKPYKMLLAWKKLNGPDALYHTLYDALCHRLVGHKELATKFCCDKGFQSGEHESSPSGTARQPQYAELRNLISCIKDVYIRRARLQLVPWCDTSVLSLQRVYTKLTMKARKMQRPALTNQQVEMYDIFSSHDDCKKPRSVLVEGDPGIGKTTFCLKMANDWATGTIPANCSFPEVELVLLLKCRDVDRDVKKAIEDQLIPKDVTDQQRKSWLEHIQGIQEKLLLILDGLDELPEHAKQDVNDVLLRKVFPHCFLVVTARQERGIHVRKEFDTLLAIKGFTRRDAFDYIERHFQEKGEKCLGSALIKEIEDHKSENIHKFGYHKDGYLSELLMNPLNTVLLCLVFEECEGKLPSTRTELYQSIVFCLLKRYCTNNGIPFDDSTLFEQFEGVLVGLGKLALDGLKEDCMYFSEKKLILSTQQVPQIGFVSKEASTKVIKPEHNYSFPHKTFQEFFAALYLAHLARTDTANVYEFISSTEDIEGRFRQVLMFVAGVLGKDGGHHFELLGQLIKEKRNGFVHPWEFLCDSFKESGHIEEMAAAIARSMSISNLVIEGDVKLDVVGYCGVQRKCEYRGHKDTRDLVTFGDVALPSGLDKFLSENTSLLSLTIHTRPSCVNDAVLASVGKGLSENTSLTSVTLDMSRCHLNDATLAPLGKALSDNTSLTSLTLRTSGCRLNYATLASLGKGLSENTSLTSLTLRISKCSLNDATLAPLGKGLSENTSLASLTLNMSECVPNDATLAPLGNGLSKNTSLESLTLRMSRCPLNDATLSPLGKALSENTSLASLTLDMTCCHLNDATLDSLGKGLSENTSLTSLTLNMSVNDLNDATLSPLGKALSENTSLTSLTLHMSGCRLNDATLSPLGKALSENTSLTSLTLHMSGCRLNDATLSPIGKALSENTSLTSLTLDMAGSDLNNATLASLGKGLSRNTSLTSLTLKMSGCRLKYVSLASLGNALSRNTSLTSLTLKMSGCQLNDASIASLGKGLSENTSLTSLTVLLSGCRLNDAVLAFVSKCLSKNTSLTSLTLNMSGCSLNDASLALLGKALSENTSLTSLTLHMSGRRLNDATLALLAKGLSKITSLKSLTLNKSVFDPNDAPLSSITECLSRACLQYY